MEVIAYKMLKKSAEPEPEQESVDSTDHRPYSHLLHSGSKSIISMLIRHTALMNKVVNTFNTASHEAFLRKPNITFKLLFYHGADDRLNLYYYGTTFLRAYYLGKLDAAQEGISFLCHCYGE